MGSREWSFVSIFVGAWSALPSIPWTPGNQWLIQHKMKAPPAGPEVRTEALLGRIVADYAVTE